METNVEIGIKDRHLASFGSSGPTLYSNSHIPISFLWIDVVARLVARLRSAWWLEVSVVEIGVETDVKTGVEIGIEIGVWWVWWYWHGGQFLGLVAGIWWVWWFCPWFSPWLWLVFGLVGLLRVCWVCWVFSGYLAGFFFLWGFRFWGDFVGQRVVVGMLAGTKWVITNKK